MPGMESLVEGRIGRMRRENTEDLIQRICDEIEGRETKKVTWSCGDDTAKRLANTQDQDEIEQIVSDEVEIALRTYMETSDPDYYLEYLEEDEGDRQGSICIVLAGIERHISLPELVAWALEDTGQDELEMVTNLKRLFLRLALECGKVETRIIAVQFPPD